jgi:hypothetical protein
MGSIFGVAKKGFGMLKKSKDSSKLLKRRKELGGLKSASKKPLSETWSYWDEFKRMHRPEPGRPGTPAAKQKIASDFVKIRKKTKPAWKKKKLKPMED